MSLRHNFVPVRGVSFPDTKIPAINAAREAIRNIPQGILEERDVIELVSGVLGRHKSMDGEEIDRLLRMAAADYCNTIAK